METYGPKRTQVFRRQQELDEARKHRYLTEQEVREYFTLAQELRTQAGESDEEEETAPDGRPKHYIVQASDIPAWTGARFCQRETKIHLVAPPEGSNN